MTIKFNKSLSFATTFLVSFFLLTLSVCHAQKAEKYALLVGVTNYEHSRMNDNPLKYPQNDASTVAALLKQSGYTVEILLGKEATRAAVKKALVTAGTQGKTGGAVLIGLFGHGVQYGKSAYYCPHDTSVRTVKDSKENVIREDNGSPKLEPNPDTLISMREILDALTTCGADNRILLADCCRDDPSRARGRAFGTTLTTQDLPPGTIAMFACSANEQAFEHDDWKHGAFTYAFLEHSRQISATGRVTSGVLSDRMHATVKEIVKDKTQGAASQTLYWLNSGPVDLQLKASKTELKKVVASQTTGMKFQLIPRGKFVMGSPVGEEGRRDDEFAHEVELTQDYYLGTFEVTQGQWQQVMGTAPWKGKKYVKEGDSFPAVYVSWDEAVLFCEKLSRLDGVKYRLPSEAEWERACRGGSRTSYSFGSDASRLVDHGWFDGNASDKDEKYSHAIGGKKPNGYGLYDMHGNVFEWCSDWYGEDYYESSPLRDPPGSKEGSYRVIRGGGWNNSPQYCRSACRDGGSPGNRSFNLGFRVLRSSIK